jgi:hypothetical protein
MAPDQISEVITTEFCLGQSVWVVDKVDRCITHGWVKAVKYFASTFGPIQVTYTICKAKYFVNRVGNSGYEFEAYEHDIFRSGPAALNELALIISEEELEPEEHK